MTSQCHRQAIQQYLRPCRRGDEPAAAAQQTRWNRKCYAVKCSSMSVHIVLQCDWVCGLCQRFNSPTSQRTLLSQSSKTRCFLAASASAPRMHDVNNEQSEVSERIQLQSETLRVRLVRPSRKCTTVHMEVGLACTSTGRYRRRDGASEYVGVLEPAPHRQVCTVAATKGDHGGLRKRGPLRTQCKREPSVTRWKETLKEGILDHCLSGQWISKSGFEGREIARLWRTAKWHERARERGSESEGDGAAMHSYT